MTARAEATQPAGDSHRPAWFEAFLADRGTRKPSAHTIEAHRQDFDAIAAFIVVDDGPLTTLGLNEVATDPLRAAFASYAETDEAASIRRCWSTWNVLCTYLFTAELIPAKPIPQIGRPKTAKTLPKALPTNAVADLIAETATDEAHRRSDWPERHRAIILTALLAGLRTEQLISTDITAVRRTDDGAVIRVRGRGNKDRRIPSKQHSLRSSKPTSTAEASGSQDHETTLPRTRLGRVAPACATVYCKQLGTHHPWHVAIPGLARIQESRHRRTTCPRSPRARPAPLNSPNLRSASTR